MINHKIIDVPSIKPWNLRKNPNFNNKFKSNQGKSHHKFTIKTFKWKTKLETSKLEMKWLRITRTTKFRISKWNKICQSNKKNLVKTLTQTLKILRITYKLRRKKCKTYRKCYKIMMSRLVNLMQTTRKNQIKPTKANNKLTNSKNGKINKRTKSKR